MPIAHAQMHTFISAYACVRIHTYIPAGDTLVRAPATRALVSDIRVGVKVRVRARV